LKKISDEVIRASKTEAVRSVISAQGGDVVASSPAEFADFIASERKRYEAIVREAGMAVE
jgi:tripartite-type tricarboxylate transporter receptor subunit TctC